MLLRNGLSKPETYALDRFLYGIKNRLVVYRKSVINGLVFNFKIPEWEAVRITNKMRTKARNASRNPYSETKR